MHLHHRHHPERLLHPDLHLGGDRVHLLSRLPQLRRDMSGRETAERFVLRHHQPLLRLAMPHVQPGPDVPPSARGDVVLGAPAHDHHGRLRHLLHLQGRVVEKEIIKLTSCQEDCEHHPYHWFAPGVDLSTLINESLILPLGPLSIYTIQVT